MDQSQFNEAYKSNHVLTAFPPAPPVVSTFFQPVRLAAQLQDNQG